VTSAPRVFLLSPASAAGERAAMLLRERAAFDLAVRLRSSGGAPLGEVFAFLSGLYFRGKLAYATRFAPGAVFVITPSAGLLPPETPVRREDMLRFASVPIAASEPAYRRPLVRDLERLARAAPDEARIVLLGSIATDKYCGPLLEVFGPRLLFPPDFVGRGDMSRGGLLLRAARDGRELAYVPVAGAVRHGQRPARLDPRTRVRTESSD
jgi:hypothetical protein